MPVLVFFVFFALVIIIVVRVCPKTSGGITKFSEHEAD
jgi:hypothetical protein